jgi:hypothetical protein
MLVGAEDPELEFVATPVLVVGPPGFVAGVFDAQPATPIASDTTATDRTRTTSLFIVSEYRLSFNFLLRSTGFLGIGPRSFDMLRDTQRHGVRGIGCGLLKRLKHFQNARLILKYDPCAVKRVDA